MLSTQQSFSRSGQYELEEVSILGFFCVCSCLYADDRPSAIKKNTDDTSESLPHELHRKLVAEAFWTAECEAELRDRE